jgi:hypothetical protein
VDVELVDMPIGVDVVDVLAAVAAPVPIELAPRCDGKATGKRGATGRPPASAVRSLFTQPAPGWM